MKDEQIAYEMAQEQAAEERKYRHLSDRDGDVAAARWENECERTWGA